MPSVTSQSKRPGPHAGRGRPRNPRGEGAHLRADLLDAATRLLSSTGNPESVSIRAVAKEAGVSATAAYRHFADRDDLMAAACEHLFDLFTALLLDATAGVEDPFERLWLGGEAYIRYAEADGGLYRALFSNPLHLDIDITDETAAGTTAFTVLVGMVQDCLDAGAPARGPGGGPADASYLAFQVWSWMHGLVDLRITHPSLPWPDSLQLLDDIRNTLGLVPPGD